MKFSMTRQEKYHLLIQVTASAGLTTVKPVYNGHTREPENVIFMSSCPLYTG